MPGCHVRDRRRDDAGGLAEDRAGQQQMRAHRLDHPHVEGNGVVERRREMRVLAAQAEFDRAIGDRARQLSAAERDVRRPWRRA